VGKNDETRLRREATGGLIAVANLRSGDKDLVLQTERGIITVSVSVTREQGIEPVQFEVVWACSPRKRV
jgi:hypothetical protein